MTSASSVTMRRWLRAQHGMFRAAAVERRRRLLCLIRLTRGQLIKKRLNCGDESLSRPRGEQLTVPDNAGRGRFLNDERAGAIVSVCQVGTALVGLATWQ